MMPATRRQDDVLGLIRSHIARHGEAPSIRELTEALGVASRGNVHRMLRCLEERGLIRRIPERARAIEIVEAERVPTPEQAVASILRADQFKWLQRRAAADGITLATCLREVVEEARAP